MRAWLVVSALCSASVAHAEVFLDDSTIELSGEYTYQPVHFLNQTSESVGTGVHFEDRNGVFARFVARMLFPPDKSVDDPYTWKETGKTASYLGGGVVETTTFYQGTLKEGYKTQEEREERHREKLAAANATLALNDYSTEIRVWEPSSSDGKLASNIKGGAFGMTTTLFRNHRVSFETGLRWEGWRSDTCMAATGPSTCRYKFFGMPMSLLISLGRLGRIDVGYDFNWRANRQEEGLSVVSPIRAGLTIDVLSRIFVRARAMSTSDDIKHPGFALEVGGRI